jgi:predicted TIM-barrel fold metal-dependent hydrolase
MPPIRLIDSHFHLWELGHGRYRWLEGPPIKTHFGDYRAIRRNYLGPDFLADAEGQGLVQAVHVQAEWDPADSVGETRFLAEQAKRHGVPGAIVAYADLADPRLEATLDAHAESGLLRGVRMLLRKPDELARDAQGGASLIEDPAWRRGFATLGRRGLVYDLQATAALMPAAARLAAEFPETTLVLTHCGLPLDKSEEAMKAWRAGIAELAGRPNAVAKVSGLGMLDRGLRGEVLGPIVHALLDAFGPERCLFGSNFPVDRLMGSYARLVALASELVSAWNPAALAAVMHDTAKRVYRL